MTNYPIMAASIDGQGIGRKRFGASSGFWPRSSLLLSAALFWCLACGAPEPVVERPAGGPEEPDVELAVLMGELQRHSTKLGYAIQGRHPELAQFYLEETKEVLESVRAVERWEGLPISEPLGVIVDPLLPPLEGALVAGSWSEAYVSYEALIDGCNRCHAATEHEFLVIVPPEGPPPYNQRFTPSGPEEEPPPGEETAQTSANTR